MTAETTGRLLVSSLVVLAFLSYVAALFLLPIPAEMKDMVNAAGGVLGAQFVLVIGYWVGSSAGSSAKDKAIASLSKGPGA